MFKADTQTLKDLQMFPEHRRGPSVFALFSGVSTYGGRWQLESMMRSPLSDTRQIQDRVGCIEHIGSHGLELEIDPGALDFIEHYFSLVRVPTRYSFIDGLRKKWASKVYSNNEYYIITRAVKLLTEVCHNLYSFVRSESSGEYPALLTSYSEKITELMDSPEFSIVRDHGGKRFSAYDIERIDHLFRYKHREQLRELLEIIYTLDVFRAVAVAKDKLGLNFASLREEPGIILEGLFHPFLKQPVPNDIAMDKSNITFITGANMAGKSTFMKAFGVSVYLAHMGFPVPARSMEFSVCDGMFTTINVPDDLSLGYSHFYSEVKRIRSVAETVGDGGKYVVVFDELFRGTNVKDAHEATVTIIEAFSTVESSCFLFSSHIMEAAEDLKEKIPGIQFRAFRTDVRGDELAYTYLLREGISDDRFGMYIIRREGIVDLLKSEKE